jgi:hypothetical protein
MVSWKSSKEARRLPWKPYGFLRSSRAVLLVHFLLQGRGGAWEALALIFPRLFTSSMSYSPCGNEVRPSQAWSDSSGPRKVGQLC